MAKLDKMVALASSHLQPGETVIVSVLGTYKSKLMGKDTLRTGVFLATNIRVFFFGKKMFGFETESFPYSSISSIDYGKSFLGKTISFYASGNSVTMKWINEGDVDKFISHVQSFIGKKISNASTQPQQQVSASIDVTEELRKLADLKNTGILTEEEFAAKKKQLLGI
jgi:hypothetical protein